MLKEFTKYTNMQELLNKYVVISEHNKERCGYVSDIRTKFSYGSFALYLCSSWCSSYPHTIINIPTYCLGNTVRIYYCDDEVASNNLKGLIYGMKNLIKKVINFLYEYGISLIAGFGGLIIFLLCILAIAVAVSL